MRLLPFLAMAFALSGCQPAEPPSAETPAEAPAEMSDEDALRARTDEFESAVNAADPSAIGALYAEDADVVDQAGVLHQGRAAIQERWRGLFDGAYRGAKAELEITSIRLLTPEVAVIDGSYALTGMKTPEGAEAPALSGLFTNVAVKQDGQWLVRCSRPMVPMKASGTSSGGQS